jgi:hypothetical protein
LRSFLWMLSINAVKMLYSCFCGICIRIASQTSGLLALLV